jgi:hypothetical protein
MTTPKTAIEKPPNSQSHAVQTNDNTVTMPLARRSEARLGARFIWRNRPA